MNLVLNCAFVLTFFLVLGCGPKKNVDYPRNETLYIGGFQWGAPESFNPLADYPVSWPMTGSVNLVYETLFAFNALTGELEPLLAERYELDNYRLIITLQKGARWSDGKPLTVDDVLYTFELHKKYPTGVHSMWRFISSVSANRSERTITIVLNPKNNNPLTSKDMLGSVAILPKHIFQPIENAAKKKLNSSKMAKGEYQDKVLEDILSNKFESKSFGSGPYKLLEFDSTRIVLERDDLYWGNSVMFGGNTPSPKYIVHPILASNDEYNAALEEGKLDISATYCPMVWNQKKKGVGTWESSEPYYLPGGIPSILIQNMPTADTEIVLGNQTVTATKSPLKTAAFRRAIAASIDYEMIRKRAVQGYSTAISPGLIINSGIEQIYYDDSTAELYGVFNTVTYNDVKARQNKLKKELVDSGYTWVDDPQNPAGRLKLPDGRVLADMKLTTPKGWSDWEVAAQIAVTNLRNIGIPVSVDCTNEDSYWENLGLGKFDFILKTPQDEQLPSLPWSRFETVMSSADIDTVGVFIYSNEGRYVNSEADSLLAVIPRLKSDSEVEAGYRKLNELFMKEMPVIPLMYRPTMFYQYSTKTWTGFPTLDNPYAPPSCLIVDAGRKALWGISLANKKKL